MDNIDINKYSGNAKPFLYAIFTEKDKLEAEMVLKNLEMKDYAVWFENGFSKHAKKRMEKSILVMLFMSQEASTDSTVNDAIHFAILKNLPIITIYLSQTNLTAVQKLHLNTYQCIMKYSFTDEKEFYDKIYSASVMQWTNVTPAQIKGARNNSILSWALAGSILALILFIILLSPIGGLVNRGSLLKKIGINDSPYKVKEVFVYATETMDTNKGASKLLKEEQDKYLKIIETGEKLSIGEIKDISDFAQLKSLREMVFTGNVVSDIYPLYKLNRLEYLDISCNPISNLNGIENMASLKTLNISYTNIKSIEPLLNSKILEAVNVSCDMDELFSGRQLNFKLNISDHDWGDWKTTVESTTDNEGLEERFCTTCGEVETKVISKKPHQHEFGVWDEIIEPTLDTEGLEQRFCTICNELETRAVPIIDLENISINKLKPHIFGGFIEWGTNSSSIEFYGIYIFGVNKNYTYVFKKNGTIINCDGREYVDDDNDNDNILNKTHIYPDPKQMGTYDATANYTLEVTGNGKSYTYKIKHKFY